MIVLDEEQLKAAGRICDSPQLALWAQMGAGKTLTTLYAVRLLLQYGAVEKVLITAPRMVADSVWASEGAKLGMTNIVSVTGSKAKKLALCRDDAAQVFVLGCDSLAAPQENREARWKTYKPSAYLAAILARTPAERIFLIVDESTKLKNHAAARSRVIEMQRWARVLLLTGTPMPRGAEDLYGQMRLLPACRSMLGSNLDAFASLWCRPARDGSSRLRLKNEGAFKHAFHHWIYEMEASEKNDIPYVRRVLQVPWMRDTYEADLAETLKMTRKDALGMMWIQLMCACCGGRYDRDAEGKPLGTWTELHRSKVEALKGILARHEGEPALVFILFDFQRQQILEDFPHAQMMDAQNAKKLLPAWNAGEIPLMVAHPASAGHGLNLQKGGRLIIFLGAPHLEAWQQARARLIRRGQKRTVLEYIVLAQDSLEADYYNEILTREHAQDSLWLAEKVEDLKQKKKLEDMEERRRAWEIYQETAARDAQARAERYRWNIADHAMPPEGVDLSRW